MTTAYEYLGLGTLDYLNLCRNYKLDVPCDFHLSSRRWYIKGHGGLVV